MRKRSTSCFTHVLNFHVEKRFSSQVCSKANFSLFLTDENRSFPFSERVKNELESKGIIKGTMRRRRRRRMDRISA